MVPVPGDAAAVPAAVPIPETTLRPSSGFSAFNLREIWAARYLFWNLICRDVKVPYASVSFGLLWTLARPLLFMTVLILIKRASDARMHEGVSYVLYVYSGLILWAYFEKAASAASKSVHMDAGLITKVYYPRLITPAVPVVAGMVDLGLQMALLPLGMLFFRHGPDWHLLLLPLVLLHVMVLALGVGLFVSSLSAANQDFQALLKHVLYIGFFASPVMYSVSMIPAEHRVLYHLLNPMAAPLEVFRAVLFSGQPVPWGVWAVGAGTALATLLAGALVFQKKHDLLADAVSQ
jgi:lipopolysaccharide transport system permease protein